MSWACVSKCYRPTDASCRAAACVCVCEEEEEEEEEEEGGLFLSLVI